MGKYHWPNPMLWRPFHESDLSVCLEMQPACLGDEIVGKDAALRAWESIIRHSSFLATVIESERPIAGHRIVGCGMGVFVGAAFADQEIQDPRPGLNSRVIAGVVSGESPILSQGDVGLGNVRQGLDFVNLYGTWRNAVTKPDDVADIQMLLGKGFAEQSSGYRFNRILKETIGDDQILMARATGTYQLVAEFPETGSALAVVTRESATAAPYSVAASIYRYRSPILRLRPAEQELLIAALKGKTDAELSAELGLSVEAIKKRWLSIFDRVGQYAPEILSPTEIEGEGRGPQKRHRVVAYIRNHPEELRPYAWHAE